MSAFPGRPDLVRVLLLSSVVLGGCATSAAGLDRISEEHRRELLRGCVQAQMRVTPHGTGKAVYEACADWARAAARRRIARLPD